MPSVAASLVSNLLDLHPFLTFTFSFRFNPMTHQQNSVKTSEFHLKEQIPPNIINARGLPTALDWNAARSTTYRFMGFATATCLRSAAKAIHLLRFHSSNGRDPCQMMPLSRGGFVTHRPNHEKCQAFCIKHGNSWWTDGFKTGCYIVSWLLAYVPVCKSCAFPGVFAKMSHCMKPWPTAV